MVTKLKRLFQVTGCQC